MKRPKMDSYDLSTKFTMCEFIRDLEKYCNELEKTLNKACKRLADGNMYVPKGVSIEEFIDWNEEDWKRWLSKDE